MNYFFCFRPVALSCTPCHTPCHAHGRTSRVDGVKVCKAGRPKRDQADSGEGKEILRVTISVRSEAHGASTVHLTPQAPWVGLACPFASVILTRGQSRKAPGIP